jgi:hypothetical protein
LPIAAEMAGMVTFVRYKVAGPLGMVAVSTVHPAALLCSCRRAFCGAALLCKTDCEGNNDCTVAAELVGTTNRDVTVLVSA